MLIDSHCHLDYLERKGEDIATLLADAREQGIRGFLTVATTCGQNACLKGYCDTHPDVVRSVGVHPNHAHEEPGINADDLLELAKDPRVVALGETGIDYFRGDQTKDLQQKIFAEHISAAQTSGLPLIIHTRSADHDTINPLLEAYREQPFTGVFHCYIGSHAVLEAAREMDFLISLTGILTYSKSADLRAIISEIPPERLMVETDAPFLAPNPHRGKPCTPAMVRHTAETLAELLGLSLEALGALTTANFFRLFPRAQQALKVVS